MKVSERDETKKKKNEEEDAGEGRRGGERKRDEAASKLREDEPWPVFFRLLPVVMPCKLY